MIEGIIYLQVTCMSCICCPLSVSHGVKGLVCLSLRMQRCRRPGSGFIKGFLLAQGNTPKYRMQKTPRDKTGKEARKPSRSHVSKIPECKWKWSLFCDATLPFSFPSISCPWCCMKQKIHSLCISENKYKEMRAKGGSKGRKQRGSGKNEIRYWNQHWELPGPG